MAQSTWASQRSSFFAINLLVKTVRSCRATRATALPKLSQFLSNLLTGRSPVHANTISDFRYVALEIQLVFLQPGHIEFLSRCATLELAGDVFLVITHDSVFISKEKSLSVAFAFGAKDVLGNYARRANPFGSLSDEKFASFLDWLVNIIAFISDIW